MCVVFVSVESSQEILDYLLDLVEGPAEPYIHTQVIQMMIDNPMFLKREENNLNTEALVNRLWNMIK